MHWGYSTLIQWNFQRIIIIERWMFVWLLWLLNLIEAADSSWARWKLIGGRGRKNKTNRQGKVKGYGVRCMTDWRGENKYPPNEHGNWRTRLRVLEPPVLPIRTSEVERYLCPSLNSKSDDILSLPPTPPVFQTPSFFSISFRRWHSSN